MPLPVDQRRDANRAEKQRALDAGLAVAREMVAAGRYCCTIANAVTEAMMGTVGVQPINDPTAFKPSSLVDLVNAAHLAAREASRDEAARTPDSVVEAMTNATQELL